MDTLIGLTDAIQKLDLNLEGMIKKIEKQHKDLEPTWDIKISTSDGDSIMNALLIFRGCPQVLERVHLGGWKVSKVTLAP